MATDIRGNMVPGPTDGITLKFYLKFNSSRNFTVRDEYIPFLILQRFQKRFIFI